MNEAAPIFNLEHERIGVDELRRRCHAPFDGCDRRAEMTDGVEFILGQIRQHGMVGPLMVGGRYATHESPPAHCTCVYQSGSPDESSACLAINAIPADDACVNAYAVPAIPDDDPHAAHWRRDRGLYLNLATLNRKIGCALITP